MTSWLATGKSLTFFTVHIGNIGSSTKDRRRHYNRLSLSFCIFMMCFDPINHRGVYHLLILNPCILEAVGFPEVQRCKKCFCNRFPLPNAFAGKLVQFSTMDFFPSWHSFCSFIENMSKCQVAPQPRYHSNHYGINKKKYA